MYFGVWCVFIYVYFGVYVFVFRYVGLWLDEGFEEIFLGCDLRELRKEDFVLYGGKKKVLVGGGGWEGVFWLKVKGLFCLWLVRMCVVLSLGIFLRFW